MANHEMTSMGEANADGNDSMNMSMSAPKEYVDEVRAKELQLQQMRAEQRQLELAYQREVAAQKKEDALAHELMERDPRGHIEMMKMEQEHRQLSLEFPRLLLQREAQVYQELQSAQAAAQAKTPDAGTMMGQMVSMARWSQVPLMVLGLWLIASPFTLGYRSVLLTWNDMISGILVMVLAVIAFRSGRAWAA